MSNPLAHFIRHDTHSRNDAVCPTCGSSNLIKTGYNKLREETTMHCTDCGKKHKLSNL